MNDCTGLIKVHLPETLGGGFLTTFVDKTINIGGLKKKLLEEICRKRAGDLTFDHIDPDQLLITVTTPKNKVTNKSNLSKHDNNKKKKRNYNNNSNSKSIREQDTDMMHLHDSVLVFRLLPKESGSVKTRRESVEFHLFLRNNAISRAGNRCKWGLGIEQVGMRTEQVHESSSSKMTNDKKSLRDGYSFSKVSKKLQNHQMRLRQKNANNRFTDDEDNLDSTIDDDLEDEDFLQHVYANVAMHKMQSVKSIVVPSSAPVTTVKIHLSPNQELKPCIVSKTTTPLKPRTLTYGPNSKESEPKNSSVILLKKRHPTHHNIPVTSCKSSESNRLGEKFNQQNKYQSVMKLMNDKHRRQMSASKAEADAVISRLASRLEQRNAECRKLQEEKKNLQLKLNESSKKCRHLISEHHQRMEKLAAIPLPSLPFNCSQCEQLHFEVTKLKKLHSMYECTHLKKEINVLKHHINSDAKELEDVTTQLKTIVSEYKTAMENIKIKEKQVNTYKQQAKQLKRQNKRWMDSIELLRLTILPKIADSSTMDLEQLHYALDNFFCDIKTIQTENKHIENEYKHLSIERRKLKRRERNISRIHQKQIHHSTVSQHTTKDHGIKKTNLPEEKNAIFATKNLPSSVLLHQKSNKVEIPNVHRIAVNSEERKKDNTQEDNTFCESQLKSAQFKMKKMHVKYENQGEKITFPKPTPPNNLPDSPLMRANGIKFYGTPTSTIVSDNPRPHNEIITFSTQKNHNFSHCPQQKQKAKVKWIRHQPPNHSKN